MKIIKTKFHSLAEVDEEWVNNKIAEQERNKKRNERYKKLNLHDKVAATTMWEDTDKAGRQRYRRNQAVSGAIGGAVVGIPVKIATKSNGKAILSALGGNLVAKAVTHKRNRRIAEKIWDKGDKEIEGYINSSPRKKKRLEEEYTPIGWRVNRKGEDLETPIPYYGPSLKKRVDEREKYIRRVIDDSGENKRHTSHKKKSKNFSDPRWQEARKGALRGLKAGLALSVIPAGLGGIIGRDKSSKTGKIAAGTALLAGSTLGAGLGALSGYNRGKRIIKLEEILKEHPERRKELDYIKRFTNALLNIDNFYLWLNKKDPKLYNQSLDFTDLRVPVIEPGANREGSLKLDIFEFYVGLGWEDADEKTQFIVSYNIEENKLIAISYFKNVTKYQVKDLKSLLINLLRKSIKQESEKDYIRRLQEYYDFDDMSEIDNIIKTRRELIKQVSRYTDDIIRKISSIN